MRGNNVMKGYFDAIPRRRSRPFAGGWFHSGDLGVMHPDGYIELRDREKDIIISGGENISTIEVEQTIVEASRRARMRRRRDASTRSGASVPKAFVTLRPAHGAHAGRADRLLPRAPRPLQVPERRSSSAELPKTSTGKIQKFRLREREWSGRAKRIG